ncbi:dCTP deaminase [bacterium]|nr:dCTP deaminase [bacterium]
MILTGEKITEEVNNKKIIITPFNKEDLNTNSYDFHLSNRLLVYKSNELDFRENNPTEELIIPKEGLTLSPDKIYIGQTAETIGSKYYVPIIRGRSSTGRLGLYINITSDLKDLGDISPCELTLHVVEPLIIYPNIKIGQVTFWTIED